MCPFSGGSLSDVLGCCWLFHFGAFPFVLLSSAFRCVFFPRFVFFFFRVGLVCHFGILEKGERRLRGKLSLSCDEKAIFSFFFCRFCFF